ncbi:NlpC/P60 family protein [Parapedobacter defluvii]|uniref:C40 family peptidase n=1 Tax=Parapedobacter defluvii TaxID=2045106 RepID=UPI0033412ED9
MKIWYVPLLSLFYLMPSFAKSNLADSAEYKKILQITEQTIQQFIPDKRTAIFELKLLNGSSPHYQVNTTESAAAKQFSQLLVENHIPRTKIAINLLPDSSVEGKVTGIVNLSVANLRVEPSNQSELATQILLGTQVDLLQRKDGYYRVRTPEGYIAWVSESSITPKSATQLEAWQISSKVIVTADFGHAYTQPDEQSLRISDLVMGDILTMLDASNDFVHVSYPDGRIGYINSKLVLPFDKWLGTRRLTADNVIKTAETMMGLPYLWGGTSVKGVDCSGFTKTAFYMNGLVIPRDASQQVLAGQPIDILSGGTLDIKKAIQNLQPGDLLFFASGTDRPPTARVTHVALYLGNGEFIHAAGSVQINSLLPEASNYGALDTRTLIAARRYIGQDDSALQPLAEHPYYNTGKK